MNALETPPPAEAGSSLDQAILRLAVPNILSNLSIPILGMVDTALMGRLDSEIYIGAVALGSVLFNFIYWGFGFLRMGTTGLTAQAYGRGDGRDCTATLGRALLVALAGGMLLVILQAGLAWIGFNLIQGDAAVKSLARQYFSIRIYAAPASLALFAFHGWFLGMQNARFPMILTFFANMANIAFNVLFVFRLGMTSDGVALGTVCAQYLGLILALALFLWKYRPYARLFEISHFFRLADLKRFYSVNVDIFIRTICLIFSFAFFVSASAGMDSMVLAANQILLQYLSLMSYGVDGFAFAAESLVGRLVGASRSGELRHAIRRLFMWGAGLGAAFALFYGLFGRPLLRLFTDQPDILAAAAPFVPWLILLPLVGSLAYMWDGVYIGATATSSMRNLMLLATFGVFLPACYLFTPMMGNHGLWLALSLYLVARALSLALAAGRRIYAPDRPTARHRRGGFPSASE